MFVITYIYKSNFNLKRIATNTSTNLKEIQHLK